MKMLAVVTTISFLSATTLAHADSSSLAADTPAKPAAPATPAAPAPAAPAADEFGFDLTPEKPKKTAAEELAEAKHAQLIARQSHLRRNLLLSHQAFGFATLGLLAVTLVLGTLNYVDKFGGGTDNGTYYNWHSGFAGASSVTFATTGLLALFAPNPYPKPLKFDTALLHKIMMALATACMAANLVLGPISASVGEGKLFQRDLAVSHLAIGFGAFGFMAAGTIAFVVK